MMTKKNTSVYHSIWFEGLVIPGYTVEDGPRPLSHARKFRTRDDAFVSVELDLLVVLLVAILDPVDELTADVRSFLLYKQWICYLSSC